MDSHLTCLLSLPVGQKVIFSAHGCSVLATSLQRHVCGSVAYLILHVSAIARRCDWLSPVFLLFLLLANIVARLVPPSNLSNGSRMSLSIPEWKVN